MGSGKDTFIVAISASIPILGWHILAIFVNYDPPVEIAGLGPIRSRTLAAISISPMRSAPPPGHGARHPNSWQSPKLSKYIANGNERLFKFNLKIKFLENKRVSSTIFQPAKAAQPPFPVVCSTNPRLF
jgi:hypothetical protein